MTVSVPIGVGVKYASEAHSSFVFAMGVWHHSKRERVAFIYLVGLLKVTRAHWKEIFDHENDQLKPECLKCSWITPLARKALLLAFNLFCNWMPEDYPEDCSPASLFEDKTIGVYLLEAVRIRYGIICGRGW